MLFRSFTIIDPANGFEATASQAKWSNWGTTGISDLSVNAATQVINDNSIELKVNNGKLSATTTSKATATTTVNTTYNTVQARTGLQIDSRERVITSSIGERIIDSSLLPYIRSRSINYVASGLRPNTQLFATFDGVDVSNYCYPASVLTFAGNTLANVSWLQTLDGSSNIYAIANVIHQRKDGNTTVLFVKHSAIANVFAAGNVATLNRVILPVIRRVMPTVIANEIIGVQPMTGPVSQIHTLRVRYADNVTGTGGATSVTAGDEALSPFKIASAYSGGTNGYPSSTAALEGVPGNRINVQILKQEIGRAHV